MNPMIRATLVNFAVLLQFSLTLCMDMCSINFHLILRLIEGRLQDVNDLQFFFGNIIIFIHFNRCFSYLSQGISMSGLAHEFQIGKTTAMKIIHEVCDAICESMKRAYLPLPKRQKWLQNAEAFEQLGFPRAIGAIDGKHFWCKV